MNLSDIELFKLVSPEEQDQHLDMLRDVEKLGPKPTRKQLSRALLPHLQQLFGDVYDDYKDELEVTYNSAATQDNQEGNK
jgi:hypothetical protein